MDQKHSMMYPSLTGRPGQSGGEVSSSTSHRSEEPPAEAPPSYDIAMGTDAATSAASAPYPTPHIGFQSPNSTDNSGLESYTVNPIQHPVSVESPDSLEPIKLGPRPSKITCPECGERRRTRMHFTANRKTHIFALVLCLVGWCCCACSVPYCMRSCKTGHHYCAKCNRFLGSYDRNES
ncbi:lipopolysaccharide-induced tumor necrosis factor-alpha factor homolog [Episyrphus balteatus]|uniref:lipopolysaccharide-induced tumor necrosis factor-alpha factor homolog n=1 Tax=Episyrphus balteatus TaxID=286459 RepID=UPI0024865104|nr:lipopolysaccharide-induced tumor necrosis factor-alpha factor homolog [Episyrphus balteatus]